MAGFTISRTVSAPLERVFQVFSDLESAPERITGIQQVELLSPGPVRAGTRWRETRVVLNRECTEELEITRFEPDRSYTAECESCGARFVSTFEFAEQDAGTAVTVTVHTVPVSLVARLLSPLTGLMMSSCRKAMEQDVDDLVRFLEAPADSQTEAGHAASG